MIILKNVSGKEMIVNDFVKIYIEIGPGEWVCIHCTTSKELNDKLLNS